MDQKGNWGIGRKNVGLTSCKAPESLSRVPYARTRTSPPMAGSGTDELLSDQLFNSWVERYKLNFFRKGK